MQTLLVVFTSLIGIALAFYNAWAFAMATVRDKYYNKLVHRTGGFIRFLWIVFIIAAGIKIDISAENITFDVIFAGFWFFVVYNILYNQLNGEGWFYFGTKKSGTKSVMDIWFGKLYLPVYVIILFLIMFWYPLKLFKFITITLMQSFKEQWVSWIIVVTLIISTILVVRKFYIKRNEND